MNIPRKISSFFLVLILLAGLLGLAQPVGASAPLMADMWVTDGTVYATLLSGSTLYIGGSFSYVGPPTGGFAALDAAGAPDRTFPPVAGEIYAVAPDGAGGWYVGGRFTHVGGHPRNNLAHLKADKSLDFTWRANTNYPVYALVVAPPIPGVSGSKVYVGGGFDIIGDQPRNYIAALDASTGLVMDWNADPSYAVYALALSNAGDTIYVGGWFHSIGGQERNNIAALDTNTGLVTDWNPDANLPVNTLAVAPPIPGVGPGGTIYAGGEFTHIGGQLRNNIAALDASTGSATAWDANLNYYSPVRALAVAPDGTIYTGGSFNNIGGQPRNNIAALDAGTGLATDWNPNANGTVNALAVSGRTIYAGGGFGGIGGQARRGVAALDASTGRATLWNPNANGTVRALAAVTPISGVAPSSTVAIGGSFSSTGGQTRNRIAALDTSTGRATDWNPNANNNVYALAIAPPILGVSGSTLYAGGSFTNIGGQGRNRIAALDASTGLPTAWNPNADNTVRALAGSGSTLYAGGDFTSIGGQPRNRIAVLDASTGSATAWNPNADHTVRALALSGSTLYAGGDFTSIGGQGRNRIAALEAGSGSATSWNPDANEAVYALALNDSALYAGGNFTNIGGQFRGRIAALDASTGLATSWNPNASGPVYTLAALGSTIYAGGDFSSIGGQSRRGIAALDASTGLATSWNPDATNLNQGPPGPETNVNGVVYTLATAPSISGAASPTSGTASGSTIYAGGWFAAIVGRGNSNIAGLRGGTATCQSAGSGGSWQVSHWSNCGSAVLGDGDSVVVQNGHALTLYGSLAANDLTVNAGGALELPPGSSLSVEGSVTHNGRLSQSQFVPATATITFLNLKNAAGTVDKFFGASLTPEVGGATPAGDMGYTRVSISGNQSCTILPTDPLIKRCFNITPTTAQNATLRLYYTHAELNSQTYNTLKLWHWGSGWAPVGDGYTYSATCGVGQSDCWMEAKNVSGYLSFVLGSQVYTMRWFMPLLRR